MIKLASPKRKVAMMKEVRRKSRPFGSNLPEMVFEVPAECLIWTSTSHKAVATGAVSPDDADYVVC